MHTNTLFVVVVFECLLYLFKVQESKPQNSLSICVCVCVGKCLSITLCGQYDDKLNGKTFNFYRKKVFIFSKIRIQLL